MVYTYDKRHKNNINNDTRDSILTYHHCSQVLRYRMNRIRSGNRRLWPIGQYSCYISLRSRYRISGLKAAILANIYVILSLAMQISAQWPKISHDKSFKWHFGGSQFEIRLVRVYWAYTQYLHAKRIRPNLVQHLRENIEESYGRAYQKFDLRVESRTQNFPCSKRKC
jgi:hypothetical protein